MQTTTARWWPLLLVALLAAGTAMAEEHDELSKGNWDGKSKFTPSGGGGSGGGDPPPPPPEDPPNPPEPEDGGGTPTPEPEVGGDDGGTGDDGSAGDDAPATGEGEPEPGDEGSDGDADGGDEPPAPPVPTPPPTGCNGKWMLVEMGPDPKLVELHTAFTLLLFRTDSFGYISNGYSRAHSTSWFDWFATTQAGHSTGKDFRVEMRLVGGCGSCAPRIDVQGNSQLETRVQVKSHNGGIDAASYAHSSGWTVWSGPLLCDIKDGVQVVARQGSSKISAKKDGAGIEVTSTTSRVYASSGGGKGDFKVLQGPAIIQKVHNHGDISVYAGGAENNSQAKVRVAHGMVFQGRTACGATGDYELDVLSTD